jgi:predicted RNase H-like HicB family nuclease
MLGVKRAAIIAPHRKAFIMKYKIALRESEEGFSVSVPGLPGCWSQGATEQEALQNIQDAIKEYLTTIEDLLEGTTVREIEVQA